MKLLLIGVQELAPVDGESRPVLACLVAVAPALVGADAGGRVVGRRHGVAPRVGAARPVPRQVVRGHELLQVRLGADAR